MFRPILAVIVTGVLGVGSASGAVVGFQGRFINNPVGAGSGSLGDVSPFNQLTFGSPPPFSPQFAFGEGPGNQPMLNTLMLPLSRSGPLWIVGGSARFNDNALDDTAEFVLAVSTLGPSGSSNGIMTFNFSGDLFSGGSLVSQANMDELIDAPDFGNETSITYTDFSNGTSIYTGLVSAVPEPSSIGLLLAFGSLLRFRRRQAACLHGPLD